MQANMIQKFKKLKELKCSHPQKQKQETDKYAR